MKRLIPVLFLCAVCLFCAAPTPFAAALLGAPEVKADTPQTTAADTVFRFSVSAPEAAAYEAYRRENYETVSKTYTDDQIAASDASWLLYPVVLLCEAARTPGQEYAPVCAFTPMRSGAAEVSLTKDVLPALADAGVYTEEAFSFSLRFSVAAVMGGGYQPLSDRGEAFSYACPATVHITYELPAGADNDANPSFLFAPMTEPLLLQNPSMRGYVFAGWQTESGVFVDTVTPASAHTKLCARFTPCVYKISYVLATRPGYSFVHVSNNGNPKTYTCGETTPLYAVKPPYGYVFGGWYRDAGFSGKAVSGIGPDESGDVILYARWLTTEEAEDAAAIAAGWGDLDNDGAVTAADARLALRAAVELENLPPAVVARADFARLGRLNASCARILLRVAVGLDRMSDVLKQHGLM